MFRSPFSFLYLNQPCPASLLHARHEFPCSGPYAEAMICILGLYSLLRARKLSTY